MGKCNKNGYRLKKYNPMTGFVFAPHSSVDVVRFDDEVPSVKNAKFKMSDNKMSV